MIAPWEVCKRLQNWHTVYAGKSEGNGIRAKPATCRSRVNSKERRKTLKAGDLKKWDTVQQKSGGPVMIIGAITKSKEGRKKYFCGRPGGRGGKLKWKAFLAEELIAYKEKKPAKKGK